MSPLAVSAQYTASVATPLCLQLAAASPLHSTQPSFSLGSVEIPGGSRMLVIILGVSLVAESEKV